MTLLGVRDVIQNGRKDDVATIFFSPKIQIYKENAEIANIFFARVIKITKIQ